MRWADRSIAFVSTLILARLLVPEDFGVIAMASLVIGLADVFFELGVNVALIQNKTPSPAHYDTAWTLRLIQTTLAAIIVVIASPWAATYFNDPRVTLVTQVLAVSLILSGLENIGVVTFQKEMQFGREFQFLFCKRIVGFIVTIVAAWFIRSYWAMVIGALAGRTFGVALSFAMHPMRPRLSLKKFGEIFSVSQWMLVRSIGGYLSSNCTMRSSAHVKVRAFWAPIPWRRKYPLCLQASFLPRLTACCFPLLSESRTIWWS